ncbi:MAG: hypothetical protein QM535_21880 [Limnohabitans sp.]|nr:hypothetical protein [Limnohabitans sp.]
MKNYIFFLFVILIFGCTTSSDNPQKATVHKKPPPLPANEQKICDSLKNAAYSQIRKGDVTIVFNDTIRNNEAIYVRFVSVLKNRLGFNYFRLYDVNNFETLPYKYCVQPIMDSVIEVKYGKNAKDSIVNLAYKMAIEKG